MPEPRETHAAIDARRNARGGGGDVHDLALLLAQHQRLDAPGGKCSCGHETALGDLTSRHVANAVIAAGWLPEWEYTDLVRRTSALDREWSQLRETVQRVTALAAKWTAVGPEYIALPDATAQLRVALDAAPSDPATDTGGEGHG